MRHIADLTDFEAFKQAVGQYASDRAALKAIKSALMDKKTEIELKLDSPFFGKLEGPDGEEWCKKAMAARDWTVRKMNHVDGFLSKTKVGEVVGWIMWVIDKNGDGKWLLTSVHPVQWLANTLPEEDEPNDILLSHFYPTTEEQWKQFSNIERA